VEGQKANSLLLSAAPFSMEQPHHETRNLGLLEIFSDEILLHIVSFLDGFSVAVLSVRHCSNY
jgi:hypothetical protein